MESKFLLREYFHDQAIPERAPYQVSSSNRLVYNYSIENSNESCYVLVKFKRKKRFYSVYLKSSGWWSDRVLIYAYTSILDSWLYYFFPIPDELKKGFPLLEFISKNLRDQDEKIGILGFKFVSGYKDKMTPVTFIKTDVNFSSMVDAGIIPDEIFWYVEKLISLTDKAVEEYSNFKRTPFFKKLVEIKKIERKKKEEREAMSGFVRMVILGFKLYQGLDWGAADVNVPPDFSDSCEGMDWLMIPDNDSYQGVSFTGSYNENEAEYWEMKAEDASDDVEEYLRKASEAIESGDKQQANLFNKWAEDAVKTRDKYLDFAKSHRDKL